MYSCCRKFWREKWDVLLMCFEILWEREGIVSKTEWRYEMFSSSSDSECDDSYLVMMSFISCDENASSHSNGPLEWQGWLTHFLRCHYVSLLAGRKKEVCNVRTSAHEWGARCELRRCLLTPILVLTWLMVIISFWSHQIFLFELIFNCLRLDIRICPPPSPPSLRPSSFDDQASGPSNTNLEMTEQESRTNIIS